MWHDRECFIVQLSDVTCNVVNSTCLRNEHKWNNAFYPVHTAIKLSIMIMINEMMECFIWNQFTFQWHKFSSYDFIDGSCNDISHLLLNTTHKWYGQVCCMLRFATILSLCDICFYMIVTFYCCCKTCNAYVSFIDHYCYFTIWIAPWQTNEQQNRMTVIMRTIILFTQFTS